MQDLVIDDVFRIVGEEKLWTVYGGPYNHCGIWEVECEQILGVIDNE